MYRKSAGVCMVYRSLVGGYYVRAILDFKYNELESGSWCTHLALEPLCACYPVSVAALLSNETDLRTCASGQSLTQSEGSTCALRSS